LEVCFEISHSFFIPRGYKTSIRELRDSASS
jgi:hypothetical protein